MANNLSDRKGSPPPDPKHNQSQEQKDADRSATLVKRLHELRQKNAICDKSAAAHKENTDARTEVYRFMKAELGLTRPQVDEYLRKTAENARDLIRAEEIRQKDYATLKLPTHAQLDLFRSPETQDGAYWRIEGYKLGLAFGERAVPSGCVGDAIQEFLAGYDDGAGALQSSLTVVKAEVVPEVEPVAEQAV